MTPWKRIARIVTMGSFLWERAEFYRDLAAMFETGEPLRGFLEGETQNAYRVKDMAKVRALKAMQRRLSSGEEAGRLGYVLQGVMPQSDQLMIASVEMTDDKPAALRAMANAIDLQREMLKIVALYSVLPLALIPVCAVLVHVLGDVILTLDRSAPDIIKPQLWAGFNGASRDLAQFMRDYGAGVLAIAIAMPVALLVLLPRWTGKVRLKADRWPVFTMYRDFQAGMVLTALAALLSADRPLKASLEDLSQRSGGWVRWQLRRIQSALEDRPNAVVDAFGRGLLSNHLLGRAATLNRTATEFSEVLIKLGTSEGGRVRGRVQRAAISANLVLVGALTAVAVWLGIASMTVPTSFARLVEPSNLMMLKQQSSLAQPGVKQ